MFNKKLEMIMMPLLNQFILLFIDFYKTYEMPEHMH